MGRDRLFLALGAALLLFALAVALAWPEGRRDRWPAEPDAAPAPAVEAAPGGGPDPHASRSPARTAVPPSLAGSEVAGALAVDADGAFVPGPEALELFDWYLSATGEEPDDVLEERIRAEIRRRLQPPADAQALAFLDRYLGYRTGARELTEGGLGRAPLERRLQVIRELRRAHFGAALAEHLFGPEEAMMRVDLERMRVAADPDLGAEERAAELAALEAELPEGERRARHETRAHLALRDEERALREAGASDAELHALRAERHGEEAADRLAALDAERARWHERVAAYRIERDGLRAGAEDDAAYVAALAELRARSFEGPELVRIEALDALEAGGP